MGYSARLNLRSMEGGKPRQFVAFNRVLRGIDVFACQGNRAGLDRWLATKELTDAQRAQIEKVWSELDKSKVEA